MGDPRHHGHPVRRHLKEHGCHCEDALEATNDLNSRQVLGKSCNGIPSGKRLHNYGKSLFF